MCRSGRVIHCKHWPQITLFRHTVRGISSHSFQLKDLDAVSGQETREGKTSRYSSRFNAVCESEARSQSVSCLLLCNRLPCLSTDPWIRRRSQTHKKRRRRRNIVMHSLFPQEKAGGGEARLGSSIKEEHNYTHKVHIQQVQLASSTDTQDVCIHAKRGGCGGQPVFH